jgi:hypothetical protein
MLLNEVQQQHRELEQQKSEIEALKAPCGARTRETLTPKHHDTPSGVTL